MTFVLSCARTNHLSPAIANEFEAPEIFENGDRTAAEDFDPLLGEGLVAVRKIADATVRSVGETKGDDYVIAGVPSSAGQIARSDFHGHGAREESQKVDEMTDLSEQAPATNVRIAQPVIRRDVSGVHSILHRQRLLNVIRERFQLCRHWREAAIEANQQRRFSTARLIGPNDVGEFLPSQA